jgi:hypothetical protein
MALEITSYVGFAYAQMRNYGRSVMCDVVEDMIAAYHRVPGASAETERVVANAETADTVVMAL